MKTLGLLVGLLCVGLLAQGNAPKLPDRDRYGFFLTANRSWARLPFELHSNLIVIPIRINQSDTLRFILDTGVSHTIVTDPKVLSPQSLTIARTIKITGVGEDSVLQARVAVNNLMQVGHLQDNHHNLIILDDDRLKLSEFVGTQVHGVFGYELFANYVVTIDFQSREIILRQPDTYKYKKSQGDRFPVTIKDTKVYTDALTVFDGEKEHQLRVILDTGAGHALLLDKMSNDDAVQMPKKQLRTQLGRGLNGIINGTLGRIGKIRFGKYDIDNMLVSFPDSTSFRNKLANQPQRQGNIGCELLRRFRVTFNYRDQYIVLKPNKRLLREQFEHDMSGMEICAKGSKYNTFVVSHILANSPAAEAGLKEGDELMFIDNRLTSDLSISDIYRVLQRGDGKEITLLVKRHGQVFITDLRLKRMI